MNQIDLINGLIEELKALKYKDETKLDAIVRKAEMIIRNVFSSDSKYINNLHDIGFHPMFVPAPEQSQLKSWQLGTAQMQNLFTTMKEEVELFGAMPKMATKEERSSSPQPVEYFIDSSRIDELREIKSLSFDLKKLIRLCEELNQCYTKDCFLAVAMLTRAVLDHVPPIFSCKSFTEIANNYGDGNKSFKESMQHLENSSRKIADAHLHGQIRQKESLPNKTQVNFSSDLDVLLAEVARVLKT